MTSPPAVSANNSGVSTTLGNPLDPLNGFGWATNPAAAAASLTSGHHQTSMAANAAYLAGHAFSAAGYQPNAADFTGYEYTMCRVLGPLCKAFTKVFVVIHKKCLKFLHFLNNT